MVFGFQTIIVNLTSPDYLKKQQTSKLLYSGSLEKTPACLLFLKNLSNIAGVITEMAWLKKCLLHRALQFNFDRITGLVDKGDRVDVIHLLISKLSDTVPHDILIIKLRKYGLELDKITMRWREQLAEKLLSRSNYQWFTVKEEGSFK